MSGEDDVDDEDEDEDEDDNFDMSFFEIAPLHKYTVIYRSVWGAEAVDHKNYRSTRIGACC